MVLYESLCAAALSVGSAVCLAKLLSPQQQALNSSNSSSDPFLATLLITCLMGAFALWTVKGPHACWHPSSGSPWSGRSSSTLSAVVPPAGARAPKGDAVVNRAADDDDSAKDKASGGITETKAPITMVAHGAGADPALPQCGDDEDDGGAYASEHEGPQMDGVRLERQSSFVEMALRIHG